MKTFRYLIAGLLLLAALPSQSKEEEISVSRSWGKLSGTLTVPDEGSDAAVLIIAGSGPTDRNGNSGSGLITNTYYMLARALEKEGIASLRYDKQGIGGSRYRDPELYKQEDRLRLADYIADAEALAQARPDADKVIIEGMTHLLKQSEVTDPQRQKTTIYMDAAAPVSEKLVSVMADFIRRI